MIQRNTIKRHKKFCNWLNLYKWTKIKRSTVKEPPLTSIIRSFIAAFIGLLFIGYLSLEAGLFPLFAPFGASAVLLYGAPKAPFSQPRNLIGGHIISGIIGVGIFNLFGSNFVSIALAVALAIASMLLTRTVHPPAGATALLGVTMSQGKFQWITKPVLIGALILLAIALIFNNLAKEESYPDYWI